MLYSTLLYYSVLSREIGRTGAAGGSAAAARPRIIS